MENLKLNEKIDVQIADSEISNQPTEKTNERPLEEITELAKAIQFLPRKERRKLMNPIKKKMSDSESFSLIKDNLHIAKLKKEAAKMNRIRR